MRSVGFFTIGCKLNQFETEQMREIMEAEGYRISNPGEPADVYIVNTCTVTSKSDYRSRQAVRRAIRCNPEATIIVTGCYAQIAPNEIASIRGVDAVIGNSRKASIADYACLAKQTLPVIDVEAPGAGVLRSARQISAFGSYTRAFVKIQDGCNNCCTYCAVPLARGRSRSKPQHEVEEEVRILVERGYREVVLTGVHLGSYGKDLDGRINLAQLLRRLSKIDGLSRLRLSSVEPTDFTPELIDVIADPAFRVCPHVHIPLQSGDDRILEFMGRNYTRSFYSNLILTIADRIPNCGMGADVMVGFPGEDEAAFRNTLNLIMDLPLSYLHVFSYSPRPNTPASNMPGQIATETKKERSRILRDLGKAKATAFRQKLKGSNLEVIILSKKVRGYTTGLSGNYVEIYLDEDIDPNEIVEVEALETIGNGLGGRLIQR